MTGMCIEVDDLGVCNHTCIRVPGNAFILLWGMPSVTLLTMLQTASYCLHDQGHGPDNQFQEVCKDAC
jgi:hypothetical protein